MQILTQNDFDEVRYMVKRDFGFCLLTHEDRDKYLTFFLKAESQLTPKTPYFEFLEKVSEIRGIKFLPDLKSYELFHEYAHIYSVNDRITALKNVVKTEYYEKNPGVFKPAHICTPNFITSNIKDNQNGNKGTSEIQNI